MATTGGSGVRDDLHIWVVFREHSARDLEHADRLQAELAVRTLSSPVYLTFWRLIGPNCRPEAAIGASCIFDRKLTQLYRDIAAGKTVPPGR